MPLSPGQVLNNRYRIVKLLGQGGFGAVYRVWDLNLERPMALKENLDVTPEAQRQFKREAQILFDLSHPNLPRVIDHFVILGQGQYLVMEYVEGEDFEEMLARVGGPLPEAQVLTWIGQVCDALVYLHSQSPPIIHRDIKPANIKITPDGKAMLVDFGIAKVYDPHIRTTIGARAITPGYSPLEQYGQGATDARTDVYALGATLYHLLTGQPPPESIQRNIKDTLAAPRAYNPAISAGTEGALLKAMEPLPDRRYQSISAFKAALLSIPSGVAAEGDTVYIPRSVLTSSVAQAAQAPPTTIPRPNPWRWILGAGALLIVAATLVVVFSGGIGRSKPTATPVAKAPDFLPSSPTPVASKTPTLKPSKPPTSVPPTNTKRPATKTPLPAPTDTRPPRPTNTPEPSGPPILVMDKNYMCRGGPGADYPELWTFEKGEEKVILGKNPSGWWLVQIDDPRTRKRQCWVSGGIVEGDASQIPDSNWSGDGY